MKRNAVVVVIVVIIGIIALVYFANNSSFTNKTGTQVTNEDGTFRPDPSNATFTFDDGPITLFAGRNERPIAPESALTEETVLMNTFAYGDINADAKDDTVLLLARYGAGSGTFVYLAAFVSGPVTYKGSKVIFVGDRITPQTISINGKTITLKYLDRTPDEPFAAEPTIPMEKKFIFHEGAFQEK